eukprot:MONOS_10247.1-p1 / transcript=MONOS_10247.1 / gene=MONOS_10247 / organism=Monocercomonoides_exilis_PA203 / gene_product=unspecified product / transcript_product=unspecified product / location=Mono_scaffold00458:10983-12012(+) / protein_length=324 / sequence_SO=supercontig / SO=protein_coding / is_pseudo=false
MITKETMKKEGRNEKHLVDLCECYLMQDKDPNETFILDNCIPFLLKCALSKEKNQIQRKEVEIALLAVSNTSEYYNAEEELYLEEIKEIILHHQEHSNLTWLAYQSAWYFLIKRLRFERNLVIIVVSELHFAREAAKELEELTKRVNWNKKDLERKEEESKEVDAIKRWATTMSDYFRLTAQFKLWNGDYIGLIRCFVELCRKARENEREIFEKYFYLLYKMTQLSDENIGDLLDGGAVNYFVEELYQPSLKYEIINTSLRFVTNTIRQLKKYTANEEDKMKNKAIKMKIYEILEEEGFEDIATSFRNNQRFDFVDKIVLMKL